MLETYWLFLIFWIVRYDPVVDTEAEFEVDWAPVWDVVVVVVVVVEDEPEEEEDPDEDGDLLRVDTVILFVPVIP